MNLHQFTPWPIEVIQPFLNRTAQPALESVPSQELEPEAGEEHIEPEEPRDLEPFRGHLGG